MIPILLATRPESPVPGPSRASQDAVGGEVFQSVLLSGEQAAPGAEGAVVPDVVLPVADPAAAGAEAAADTGTAAADESAGDGLSSADGLGADAGLTMPMVPMLVVAPAVPPPAGDIQPRPRGSEVAWAEVADGPLSPVAAATAMATGTGAGGTAAEGMVPGGAGAGGARDLQPASDPAPSGASAPALANPLPPAAKLPDMRAEGDLSPQKGSPTANAVSAPTPSAAMVGAVEGAVRFVLASQTSPTPQAVPAAPPAARIVAAGLQPHAQDEADSQDPAPEPGRDRTVATTGNGPLPDRSLAGPIPAAEWVLAESLRHADTLGQGSTGDAQLADSLAALPIDHPHSQAEARGTTPRLALAGGLVVPQALPGTILGAVLSATPGGVEVALSPAELGHLRIELAPDGDHLRILLSAERPETLDLLRRNTEQLLSEVIAAGFSGAEMSFGTWTGREGRKDQDGPPQGPGPVEPTVTRGGGLVSGRFPILPAHDGGLNLRL